MCVVSMVTTHQTNVWDKRLQPLLPISPFHPLVTQQEVQEFRELLERAREYDKKNNEPKCELEEKKQKLKDLAVELGIDISFIDEE